MRVAMAMVIMDVPLDRYRECFWSINIILWLSRNGQGEIKAKVDLRRVVLHQKG